MKKITILSFGALLLVPFFAFANPIVRGGESISVDATQTLEGDFYGVASSVVVSGVAQEDVYVGGGKVTINGVIQKDLTIVGGTVDVYGEVGDDLRVMGGDVMLATPVKGDVVVVGGSLTILSTASVGGDVLFWGGELTIDGPVGGAVHGSSEDIRINATIEKGVVYTAAKSFALGDKAVIKGDLAYTGYASIVRAQDAVVEGRVNHTEIGGEDTKSAFRAYLLMLGMLLFTTGVAYFVMRPACERSVAKPISTFGTHGLIGLAVLILVPFSVSLFFVSVIGGVLGVVLLTAYIAVLVCACILSVMLIGYVVQKYIFKKDIFSLYTLVIGSVATLGIVFIPFAGMFVLFGVVMVSLGIIAKGFFLIVRQ